VEVSVKVVFLSLCAIIGVGCAHSPAATKPLSSAYIGGAGVGGSGARDCDAEHVDCFRACFEARAPWPFKYQKAEHYQYCQSKCLQEYMQCLKELKADKARSFSTMDEALAWLKRHRAEVAAGVVIVVAGTAFVVATGGAGILILAPLAL
jgi:hypothetical protein